MTFVLTGACVPDAPGPQHGSHQSELCKVIRFVAAWINYSGRGRLAVTAQLSLNKLIVSVATDDVPWLA